MKKSRLFLFAVFALLALTLAFSLASCGGDGDDTTTTTAASTTASSTTTTAATTTAVPEYTATFIADDPTTTEVEATVVGTVTFKKGATELDSALIPAVPAVAGYVGEWDNYYLPAGNVTIRATYTSLTEGSTGIVYELNEDETAYIVVGYNSNRSQLVIPATYEGKDVVAIAEFALWGKTIEALYLPASVTEIAAHAVSHCAELKTLSFSAVTAIGDYAFFGCESLETLEIPATVTTIGAYAFGGCSALADLTFATKAGAIGIGKGAFTACTALTAVDFSPVSSVTLGVYAFLGCSSLATVTPATTAMNYGNTTFFGCPWTGVVQ